MKYFVSVNIRDEDTHMLHSTWQGELEICEVSPLEVQEAIETSSPCEIDVNHYVQVLFMLPLPHHECQ